MNGLDEEQTTQQITHGKMHSTRNIAKWQENLWSKYCGFIAGEPGALYVEEADGSAVALVTTAEQLDSIMAGLNRKGLRERGLLAALRRKHAHIAAALDPEGASLDLRCVPR